ncbi:hypothetical protein LS68_002690 [Helicobacter sp. MIT 05-5293]|uniref:hypothetical protein n=1 Tax=Helicobacter sp. MIT 05-5293 TaxID=1548149 RepID=UPI00068FA11C|nr:hypothetical protein [Helicobacter sp. MIT 05-5293]TLD81940.1 hypothetical protein LS68_002690 [Helicobacter sp. MIT 05-5293]
MYASPKEINTFLKHTLSSQKYLEFGCGGSTFLVLYATLTKVISIESDASFIDQLSTNELIANALKIPNADHNIESLSPRLRFYHIDIGKTKAWGVPVDDSKRENYPLYSQWIFQTLPPEEILDIDTFFIDGRFRVACVLSTLLHCHHNSTIIIHDFFNRPQYHIVLEFLNIIDQTETLGIFKPQENLDKTKIISLLNEYQFVTD